MTVKKADTQGNDSMPLPPVALASGEGAPRTVTRLTARELWLRAQDRKRNAKAALILVIVYSLIFATLWTVGLFTVQEFSDFSGPVVVRLGKPEGVETGPRTEAPAEVAPAAPEAAAKPETPVPTTPAPVVAPALPSASPKPTPKPATPVMPAAPAPKTPTQAPTQPAPAAPAAGSQTPNVVLKGSEAGNSYDATILGGSDSVRRGAYVPINLFMPLPFSIPDSLFQRIPDYRGLEGTSASRKNEFKKAYAYDAGRSEWRRIPDQSDMEIRPVIWIMLEDAGFDLAKADYKEGKDLRPVTIRFKVAAYTARTGAPLQEVRLDGFGSGYSDIDEAVLYGFRKAQFSNSGSRPIEGVFTYRF